jgi:hypothetical protein
MTPWVALQRAGLALPTLGRSVWVVAQDAGEIQAAYPALDAALERRPGHLMVLTTRAADDLDGLARRYEREVVLPLPYRWALKQFIRRLSPKLVVLLGPDRAWRARWHRRLQAHGISVVTFDAPSRPAAAALAAHLPRLVENRELRESLRKPSRLGRFMQGPIGRHAVDIFARRRIGSWEALRQALGQPRTILCLGNGPSSEDPALAGIAPDALFRVNWRWHARGLLTSPQLVFIGDPRTPNRLSAPIFGFRCAEEANYVLWRQCLGLRPPRFRFFVFDDLPSSLGDRRWDARPTNGAIMIATAAALHPRRLVIAGIDLYRHPLGRYPGGSEAFDGYNRVHDRDVEIELIRQTLSAFAGEVDILSPILSAALSSSTGAAGNRRA